MPTPLTAAQLADALGVAVGTVSDWARRGQIPFSQIGRFRFFDLDDVLAATRQPVRKTRPNIVQPGSGVAAIQNYLAESARGSSRTAGSKRAARGD